MTLRLTKPPKPVLFCSGDLRVRGWTAAIVARFAPSPDSTRNTRYGTVVNLWRPETIEAIEAADAFKIAHRAAARRKGAARKAVETKRAAMDRWIDDFKIELPDIDEAELARLAIQHYNDRGLDRLCEGCVDHFCEATESSDPRFLARISVNFIRHAGTDYEQLLDETFGKVGSDRAYGRIKAKILDAIAAKWSGLKAECDRQKGST